MTYIPDLSSKTYNPEFHEDVTAKSVGWLGDTVPMTGSVEKWVVDALKFYTSCRYVSDDYMGLHECEICGHDDNAQSDEDMCSDREGKDEIWIEHNEIRYVLPAMILHYIEQHQYLPPKEFLMALKERWREDSKFSIELDWPSTENEEERRNQFWPESEFESDPIVRLIKKILLAALARKISEIHFDYAPDSFTVSFKIGDSLEEVNHPPRHLFRKIIDRFQLLSRSNVKNPTKSANGKGWLRLTDAIGAQYVMKDPQPDSEKVIIHLTTLEDQEL